MSTRGIIARSTGEGTFEGRYHHSGSYPTGLGAELWTLYHGHFKRDLEKMLAFLLDKHTGWSCIVGKDFSLKPGYTWQRASEKASGFANYSKLPDYRRPQCFCHGMRHEKGFVLTEKDLAETDCEWLYAFDEEQSKLFVRDLNHKEDVAVIDLAAPEPDWSEIECGENLERCGHYAWVHNLVPRSCNLSTQTWLGKKPFDFRDAIAFIVNGKRLKNTGSGGDADFLNGNFRSGRKRFPSGVWMASVVGGNGRRMDVPVAKRTGDGFQPLPGVQWVMPGTKDNPQETVIKAES